MRKPSATSGVLSARAAGITIAIAPAVARNAAAASSRGWMRSASRPQKGRVSSPGSANSESIAAAVVRLKPESVRNGIVCAPSAVKASPPSPNAAISIQSEALRTASPRLSEVS